MRDFFRAFWENWLTAMSGIASIGFWFASAVSEWANYPLSVRLGFIVAAACSMYYASFRVWKQATKKADERIAALTEEIAELRAQLSGKKDELATHVRSHQAELQRARTADPSRNALRTGIEERIRRFEAMMSRASSRPIPAGEFYPVEQDADDYLKRQFPAYENFCADFGIIGSYSSGQVVQGDEAIRRCQARLQRLREALEMLS